MFFLYHQNNSGARYIENETVRVNVIIEARTEAAAIKKAKALGLFNLPYCACCGPRFYPNSIEFESLDDAIKDCKVNHYSGADSIKVYRLPSHKNGV